MEREREREREDRSNGLLMGADGAHRVRNVRAAGRGVTEAAEAWGKVRCAPIPFHSTPLHSTPLLSSPLQRRRQLTRDGGGDDRFVATVMHPSFNSPGAQRTLQVRDGSTVRSVCVGRYTDIPPQVVEGQQVCYVCIPSLG